MAVVWRVNAANAGLVALAVISLRQPTIALLGAAAVVTVLLVDLEGWARRGRS
jgi:hypothetical protein